MRFSVRIGAAAVVWSIFGALGRSQEVRGATDGRTDSDLIAATGDPDPRVRQDALNALARRGEALAQASTRPGDFWGAASDAAKQGVWAAEAEFKKLLESLPRIAQMLDDPVPDVAVAAAEALSKLHFLEKDALCELCSRLVAWEKPLAPAVLGAIDALTWSNESGVRREALLSILGVLSEALADEDRESRLYAISIIADLGADAAATVPGLIGCLGSDDVDVVVAAADALGELGGAGIAAAPSLLSIIETNEDDRVIVALLTAIAKVDSKAILQSTRVVSLLERGAPSVRRRAMAAVLLSGEVSEEMLGRILRCLEDEGLRLDAVEYRALASGMPASERAIPPLVRILNAAVEHEQIVSVVYALERAGADESFIVERLEEILADPRNPDRVSGCAYFALYRLDDPVRIVRILTRVLVAPYRSEWIRVLVKLGELGASAAPAVATIWRVYDNLVDGERFAEAGSDVESSHARENGEAARLRIICIEALGKIGSAARDLVPAMISKYATAGAEERVALRASMTEIAPDFPGVANAVVDGLSVPRPDARVAAAMATAKLPRSADLDGQLLDLVKDVDGEVRRAAVLALTERRAAGPDVVAGLRLALEDPEERVATAAIKALLSLGHDDSTARDGAYAALGSANATVFFTAVLYLEEERLEVTDAPAVLIEMVSAPNERQRRLYAAWALGQIPGGCPQAVPALIESIDLADLNLSALCVRALGAAGSAAEAAIEKLVTLLRGRIADPSAYAFHGTSQESRWNVIFVREAIDALVAIGKRARVAVPAMTATYEGLPYTPSYTWKAICKLRPDLRPKLDITIDKGLSVDVTAWVYQGEEYLAEPSEWRLEPDGGRYFALEYGNSHVFAFHFDRGEFDRARVSLVVMKFLHPEWWETRPVLYSASQNISGFMTLSSSDWKEEPEIRARFTIDVDGERFEGFFVVPSPFLESKSDRK